MYLVPMKHLKSKLLAAVVSVNALFSGVAQAAPYNVSVTVDFNKSIAKTTAMTFGSNADEWTLASNNTNPAFLPQFDNTKITFLRAHGEFIKSWTNSTTKSWNADEINAAYNAFGNRPVTFVQNIPYWPRWMKQDSNGLLDPSEYNNYANFCAQLVNIVNIQQKRKVQYWEPFNEMDDRYINAGKINELWIIYNKAAVAMKNMDPTIKVGGPAANWENPNFIGSFLKYSLSNIDFVSWHRYLTGNPNISTQTLMSQAYYFGDMVNQIRGLISQYTTRKIPVFLGEYNINYTWNGGETRNTTIIGAVWFASVLRGLAETGADMATQWNLKNDYYGLMNTSFVARPALTTYRWANKFFVGTVYKETSNNSNLEVLAVKRADGMRSIALINKADSNSPATVAISPTGVGDAAYKAYALDANGVTYPAGSSYLRYTVPGMSFVVITF